MSSEDRRPVYAYSLKVEVTASRGVPDHLFVFQRSTEGTTGEMVDNFIQVATPLECEEVPEDAPKMDEGMPYYRAKAVTLWFRCPSDRSIAKERISGDLEELVLTYKEIEGNMEFQEDRRYE